MRKTLLAMPRKPVVLGLPTKIKPHLRPSPYVYYLPEVVFREIIPRKFNSFLISPSVLELKSCLQVNDLPTPQELEGTPEDTLEVATALDTDRENSPTESIEAVPVRVWNPAANLRGSRGRGRGGRGGRGRGRGGPRGGRGGWKRGGGTGTGPRGANFVEAPRGRGKHGRVKTSSDARIQALYNRKYALKQQYKMVAGFQREALEALGDKALELMEDPIYYKSHPEYEIVTQAITNRHEEVNRIIDAKLKMETDQAERDYSQNSDYINQLYEVSVYVYVQGA